jgi:hypothetical protein
MQFGISRSVITPDLGIELAGHGRLDRKAIGKFDDLYLTVLTFKQDSRKAMIVCADLIGFGIGIAEMLKKEISSRFGYSEQEVLLNASHTHSGPQTMDNMSKFLGSMDTNYISFLTRTLLDTIQSSLESMEEVDIYKGKSHCEIGISRRLILNRKCDFLPNENGPVNNEVTVLKFIGEHGVKGILFNYACHPSTLDTDFISSDFPGEARRTVEEAYEGKVITAFAQGCCGDIRVKTVENFCFRDGTPKDVKDFGKELGDSVIEACDEGMKKITPELSTNLIRLNLNLREIPGKQYYLNIKKKSPMFQKVWAEQMLADYENLRTDVPFSIQRISISEDTVIVGMAGEICVNYDFNLKSKYEGKTIITLGDCNGMVGYIPTDVMFKQGGYEPDDSIACYSLPSRFTGDIEETIMREMDKL